MATNYPKPLVAEVLGDERWYGNGEPRWEKARGSDQAGHRRRCCVKRLRRVGKGQAAAEDLADLLDGCAPGNRCMSGACPECSRAIQRWFVANIRRLIHASDRERRRKLVALSIVFRTGAAKPGKLDTLDLANIRRSFTVVVNAIGGIHWFGAGFDISLNDYTARWAGTGWQLQLYGTANIKDRATLSKRLRTQYLPGVLISRPVQTKRSDGSASAVSYGFKTDFVRRVTYWGTVGPEGERRKCWQTRKVSLKPNEHLELLLWLHKIGLAGRLYFRGVRMRRTQNGVMLVEIRKRQ
jgi:hypothetical protein